MLQTKEALQWSLRGFAISVINKTPIRILGIDPGLQRTGYGVIEQVGMTLRYLDSGTIIVPTQLSLAERLHTIFSSLQTVIQKNEPTIAAIEIVFFNTNAASSLLLGHARGAALCALAQAQLPVHEYTALQIKKSVVGHGKASKNQVQYMVQHLLSLNGIPSSDSADALACSICHANTSPLQTYLQQHRQTASTSAGKSRMRGGRFVR